MGSTVEELPKVDRQEVAVTIVIPVHNEETMLVQSVTDLLDRFRAVEADFEVILAENGSTDGTWPLAEALARDRDEVRAFSYPHPNYGGALREAIHRARGTIVICEEIDLCDVDFHRRAMELLRDDLADMVIGSKAMRGARDHRPPMRRLATRLYNGLLRATLGFRGTDTHGLKAFLRDRLATVAAQCVVEHDVFASELVIRAQRAGLRVVEIPVDIEEKRAPSVHILRRVPRVLRNLGRLWLAVRGTQPGDSVLDLPPGTDRG